MQIADLGIKIQNPKQKGKKMEQTELQREKTKSAIECLIFTSEIPLTIDKIRDVIEDVSKKEIKELVEELVKEYHNLERGIYIREVAHGYQFCTKTEYGHVIQKLRKSRPYHLSQPTLETLSIIAYKQPVTRAEIDAVRGVDCAGVLRSLLEKKLVTMLGKKDVIGRPFLYGTTPRFLEVFGLENLASLPAIEEVEQLKDSEPPLSEEDTQ
jgi:segregation and condensation protein B